jgi:hypothetical protein
LSLIVRLQFMNKVFQADFASFELGSSDINEVSRTDFEAGRRN